MPKKMDVRNVLLTKPSFFILTTIRQLDTDAQCRCRCKDKTQQAATNRFDQSISDPRKTKRFFTIFKAIPHPRILGPPHLAYYPATSNPGYHLPPLSQPFSLPHSPKNASPSEPQTAGSLVLVLVYGAIGLKVRIR
jgi:hypothetical protein